MYDLIGDIHGHADELVFLLEQLGYDRRRGGVYSHPTRQAVFVGDLIDRGPKIREVLHIVRGMVEAGYALCVLGNHEFNAMVYHTRHPEDPSRFLRKHEARGGKNVRLHFQTLRQVPASELYDHLEWFRGLPLWLDLGELRVVHACWDALAMTRIQKDWQAEAGITTAFLKQAADPETELFDAVEDVLKGKELQLPPGVCFHDKDGNPRRKLRVKWYESPVNQTFQTYAFQSGADFPNNPLPAEIHGKIAPYADDLPPVFFGHYWLQAQTPTPLAGNVCCLDYSVAKSGMLCATAGTASENCRQKGSPPCPHFRILTAWRKGLSRKSFKIQGLQICDLCDFLGNSENNIGPRIIIL